MSNDAPLTLKDVANAALRKQGVSGRQLQEKARKDGWTISYTTVNHLAAGSYNSRPSRSTLEALAGLSGIPLEDVYAAAEMPMPLKPLSEDLPPEADLLDGAQRRVVIDAIRQFAQQNRRLADLQFELEKAGEEHDRSASTKTGDAPVSLQEERRRRMIEQATTEVEAARDVEGDSQD